jgi:SAM-dependent methyltransferase
MSLPVMARRMDEAGERAFRLVKSLGFDPRKLVLALRGARRFVGTARTYRRLWHGGRFPLRWSETWPILEDFGSEAGTTRSHYFHQDLWAARQIFAARPREHLDVGSRVDGFVAHLLVFMPVTVMDIRPLSSQVPGLVFREADATAFDTLPDNSVESLSSLHAVEHFGLGRYGDPVDPEASFKAMRAFARVLKPGGRLYFSVPIGVERLEFNAHRVFDPMTILAAFPDLELVSFAAVDDAGDMHERAQPDEFRRARYACGLFEFTKRAST